ncbi:hypothetical protein C922_01940 [Plasmodium inui San Antonio 1]|uniref:Uncharacterized protein n=1 Tax=Plasmodium inui San Antonio 1 TaxID=1237626 RepID=W7AQP5_9APIC|nr:hypothetical protein C922_01940 [Plasmodium inui San Antonio 1]EUD67751.1 hypothetical protein C922_01940 [Plasmodium inui San Antonio 1]
MHEFYKSNNNQLVYIKPPANIDEKNILINYFLQFPSITKKLEYNKRRIYAENYGLVKIIKNSENLPVSFSLNTHPWLLEPYEDLWKEQNKLNNFGIFNMANLLRDDDDDFVSFESNQFSVTRGESQKAGPVMVEAVKTEAVKLEAAKLEEVKLGAVKLEEVNAGSSNAEVAEAEAEGNSKCDAPQPEEPPPRTPNEPGEETPAQPNGIKITDSKGKNHFLTKKIKKFCSNEDSKQLKLTSFLSREKVRKNLDVVKKGENERIDKDKPTPGELSKGVGENEKEEQPSEEPPRDSEKEDIQYFKVKKKKKRILDDEAMNEIYDSQANKDTNKGSHAKQRNGRDREACGFTQQQGEDVNQEIGSTVSNSPDWVQDDHGAQNDHSEQSEGSVPIKKKRKNKEVPGENHISYDADDGGDDDDQDDDSHDDDGNNDDGYNDVKGSENTNEDEAEMEEADKTNNHVYAALKERLAKEKKRLRKDKMQQIFELEAEESEDENIDNPEGRRKNQEEDSDEEEDEDDNSEGLNEFINNEECNSDNEIVKLKHKQEMEQLEEDIFLKKFTYQGKEFKNELTNREKLELERERQLLRRKKMLFNRGLGHVKLSDFESDSSSSSNTNWKKKIKNTMYEPFTELENRKSSKTNHQTVGGAYNEGAFNKGECHADLEGDHRRKQILEKMDNVMYTKEIKTNEGKRIVIKKKRKIRFHQDFSDVTITEEENVDAYEKTKKKPKKVNAKLVEQPKSSAVTIPNKGMNHNNKASIKWNNNIKDISELDTPTNSEVFKGFRKVENAL